MLRWRRRQIARSLDRSDDGALHAPGRPAADREESASRASLYILSVSSALVALGFIGQASETGTTFDVFALTVLPTLYVLGVFTFVRVVECGAEDFRYGVAISRSATTTSRSPATKQLFLLSGHDDGRGVRERCGAARATQAVLHLRNGRRRGQHGRWQCDRGRARGDSRCVAWSSRRRGRHRGARFLVALLRYADRLLEGARAVPSRSSPRRRSSVALLLAVLGFALVLVSTGCSGSPGSDGPLAREPSTSMGRQAYTLMQMNLCLSGLAGCYAKAAYPAVVHEAAADP